MDMKMGGILKDFRYTGEGQIGDMKFTKGNKSLLEHKQNKKESFFI